MVDDQVRSALVGPLAELGLVLDDLSIVPTGRRRVVRVAVDRDLRDVDAADSTSTVPPLTLDEVAEATRLVSDVLDGTHASVQREGDGAATGAGDGGDDLMGTAPYTLEVSSPGLDRPLRGYRAFRRNVGRLVAFGLGSEGVLTARLLSVTDAPDGATALVEVPAAKKQPASRRELRLDEVATARVQVEFNRPAASDEASSAETSADDTDDTDDNDDNDEETDDGH
ncbi:MAG: ribosome maturation factor RimP [Actinomycetota bacterium]|nr:ribosome maturation factor RimP [Actinomycetota bacterium]